MSFPIELVRDRFPTLAVKDGGRKRIYFDAPGGTQACRSAIERMSHHLTGGTANSGGAFATSVLTDTLSRHAHEAVADETWIEQLGAEGGWSVLSGDRRIATKRPSRELFLRASLVGFFPLSAVLKLPLHRQAARILTLWPSIETTAATMERGCFELGISGRLRGI